MSRMPVAPLREAPATVPSLVAPLREAPATVPSLVAIALLVVWATDQAGYPLTHWAPGAIIVMALLGMAFALVGSPLRELPGAVRLALAALAAYTALSFLSIVWAQVPGDAWEGANRTLLYLLVFALFACWRQRGASATLLLCVWVFALAGLAAYVALHLDTASAAQLVRLLPGGRLTYPSGYANANAALWLMAFWPALLLSANRLLAPLLRGALAGSAALLALVALLSQSRGSLYATPIMLVLTFALLPGRLRRFVALVPIAAAVAAAAPTVLRVGNHLRDGSALPSNLHSAIIALFAAAVAVAAIVAVAAGIERRRPLSASARLRARRGVAAVAIATLIGLVAGGWAAAGDPVARARHAWNTFKSPRGYAANGSGSRLTSGLGSNRYDFYRVALDEFIAHPILGIGADNFQQQYLVHGRSFETPHYPHSVELRTLAETGLAGTLIALVGLAAALAAGLRACRSDRADPLAAAAAAAALSAYGYWLVHGSFDWFFEFAGLGAAAFAMLGLACALTPRPAAGAPARPRSARPARATRRPTRSYGRASALALGGVAALAAVYSLGAPWLSGLESDEAVRIWPAAPLAAYARLHDAAALDPLSAQPYLLAGSIALRFGDLRRADGEFARALTRVPDDSYATLERGAVASALGRPAQARALLERSVRLQPREPLAHAALQVVREGRRLNVDALDRAILIKARQVR
jgi:tetratricopeptide (TPR) repeat protein